MSALLGNIDRARSARRQYEDDLAFQDDDNNNPPSPPLAPPAPPRQRIPRRQPSRYFDPPPPASTTNTNSSDSSLVAARHPPAYLLERHSDDEDTPFHRRHLTPAEFRDAIPEPPHDGRGTRLLVLQGVSPGAYVDVLRGSDALRMDDEFLEAHAAGRGYRATLGGTRRRWGVSWGYPEVVVVVGGSDGGKHLAGVWSLGREGLGVVFCRASLWEAPGCTPVLLVDRPAWEEGGVGRVRREGGLFRRDEEGGFIPSLEDVVREGGHQVLPDAVFDRWLALFEHLPPPTASSRDATIACYWQILHALEQNITTTPNLSTLLPHLHSRIALLSSTPSFKPPSLPIALSSTSTRPSAAAAAAARAGGILPPPPRRTGRELLDENHRALDRISYLGGVLLPLPVVSGVLSMTDAYSPDGARFWVFWAAAVPLSVVAVCVIYADTIRKAEVWVEVKGGAAAGHGTAAAAETPAEGLGGWRRWWRGKKEVVEGGQRDEEAVTVSEPAGGVDCAVPHEPRVRGAEEKGGTAEEEGPQTVFPMFLSLGVGGGGFVEVEPEPERPEMIVEEPGAGGRRGRAWRRKRLGWAGAAKAILYEKPRYCDKHMPKGYEMGRRSESY